ncbi:metallophosphoesterase family protein [Paludisphaera borealis]|uniref:3',5'-cyclic adenosine monophosphate phosphodiesterase CpdA n=1 Tax=Paludisphaera borealis TaxID=1387353 RepID=A0A1U7CUG9_9BACT|nr:metallophosphoesterase [Paludisphaera borealis]APW62539.1 3',5'-cyclic adenosine monophosphate phosphodiesterase CpdA [Paludisphaera borealis]
MPIHLLPTRRDFLSGLALGGVSTVLGCGNAEQPVAVGEPTPSALPSGYIALLSDTHINADPVVAENGGPKNNMTKNLRVAILDILKQPEMPRAVVVLGDLAHKDGQPGDYQQFLSLIRPLREFGVPFHLAMGNHDDRAQFLQVLKPEDPGLGLVDDRYIGVVNVAGIRLVILDSLDKPKQVTGNLREPQRAWLAKTLDAEPQSSTVVLVHHNPKNASENAWQCLWDTEELLAILRPRKQVKALVFGHSHRWDLRRDGDLHFVNLPAVGYPFAADQPLGWCRFEPTVDGATIELHRVDGGLDKDLEPVDLKWRAT